MLVHQDGERNSSDQVPRSQRKGLQEMTKTRGGHQGHTPVAAFLPVMLLDLSPQRTQPSLRSEPQDSSFLEAMGVSRNCASLALLLLSPIKLMVKMASGWGVVKGWPFCFPPAGRRQWIGFTVPVHDSREVRQELEGGWSQP